MRKLIFILIIIIATINSFSQDVVGSRVIAKQSFFLRNTWVDSLRRDTLNWINDYGSVPTSAAVYKFVLGHGGGGFFNPDQTSTGNTIHNGNNNEFTVDSAKNMFFHLKKDGDSQFDIFAGQGFYAEVQGIDAFGNNYFGYYDLFDVFNEIYLENGNGATMFAQNPSSSGSSTLIWSKVSGNGSFVGIEDDRIYIDARNGILELGNLTNLSTQNRLIGQYGTSTQVGYITLGTALNLTSGVLNAYRFGIEDNTSAVSRTIDMNDNDFSITDANSIYAEASTSTYYGFINLDPSGSVGWHQDKTGVGQTEITQTLGTHPDIQIFANINSETSRITVKSNELNLSPNTGNLTVTALTNLSTQDRLLGQFGTSTQVGYVTIGSGIGLASGVLTSNPPYAADAGSNDTYVITLSPAATAYTTGMMVEFKANTANTGAATITVNGLGAKTIVKRVNTTLADGDIASSMFCVLIYDGTNFVLINPITN